MRITVFSGSPAIRRLLADSVGFAAFCLSGRRRLIAGRRVLRVMGTDCDSGRRRRIVLESFRTFWRDTFDLVLLPSDRVQLHRIRILGLERLTEALQVGKGAILWESNSFGRRNLAKKALHLRGFQLDQVHSERHVGGLAVPKGWDSWLAGFVRRKFTDIECQFVDRIVVIPQTVSSLAFARRLFSLLDQNRVLCSAGDGRIGQKTIRFTFLGDQVIRSPGLLTASRQTGAPIFPTFAYRNQEGELLVEVCTPIATADKGCPREDFVRRGLEQYLTELEQRVRRYPEQFSGWRWDPSIDEENG